MVIDYLVCKLAKPIGEILFIEVLPIDINKSNYVIPGDLGSSND
jgi:hypothetical protein